jgi:hypothetical protein
VLLGDLIEGVSTDTAQPKAVGVAAGCDTPVAEHDREAYAFQSCKPQSVDWRFGPG